ncbi:hypothetical protein [Pseudogemmobacter sonorensis]|uniref:hypothetical protein n=1 Tax=Pseudogemmobacter sonorensis TaxID=2989681 RepID=UPI0036BAADE6
MNDDNIEEVTMIRKVYMLPKELVDRIASFQQDKRLPSEVEAVRRLLDEALLYRDTPQTIVERFKDRLRATGLLRAVARDLLAEHPLVININYVEANAVVFSLKDAGTYRVEADGSSYSLDPGYSESWSIFPPVQKAIAQKKADLDDDIPF